MESLYDRFTRLRDTQNSILIVGLDPKNEEKDRKVEDLIQYDSGILGFKPNIHFYRGKQDLLNRVADKAIENGLIALLDAKYPDGSATNIEGMRYDSKYFNACTIAPASGDIEATIRAANELDMETISMGAMSFPGVLLSIKDHFKGYISDIDRAISAGTAGFVLGATAYVPEDNFDDAIRFYKEESPDRTLEIEDMDNNNLLEALNLRNNLFKYIVDNMTDNPKLLALVPGFGRQGGKLDNFLASGIDLNRCMINMGSDGLKAQNPKDAIYEMNRVFNEARGE